MATAADSPRASARVRSNSLIKVQSSNVLLQHLRHLTLLSFEIQFSIVSHTNLWNSQNYAPVQSGLQYFMRIGLLWHISSLIGIIYTAMYAFWWCTAVSACTSTRIHVCISIYSIRIGGFLLTGLIIETMLIIWSTVQKYCFSLSLSCFLPLFKHLNFYIKQSSHKTIYSHARWKVCNFVLLMLSNI